MKVTLTLIVYLLVCGQLVVGALNDAEKKEMDWINSHSQYLQDLGSSGERERADREFKDILDQGTKLFEKEFYESLARRTPLLALYTFILGLSLYILNRRRRSERT